MKTYTEQHLAVFPAQAGVIPLELNRTYNGTGIPRASGGDPYWKTVLDDQNMYSPRKRG